FECFFKILQPRTQQLGLNQKLLPTDKSFIAIDASSAAPDDSSVATEGLLKPVTIDEPFIATYESSAAPDDSSIATYGLSVEYMLQYQAKLGQNQKFVQTESITIAVDCYGEWIEKNNRFIWRWKDGDMSESVLMTVQRDILYNDFVNSIISYCRLNCQPNDLVISYMHKSFENQRVLPFKISNQLRLSAYLSDATRFVLRVYVVEKPIENENVGQDQQNLLNDELNGMNMNILDDEIGHDVEEDQIPIPIVDIKGSSQLKQLNNLQDDETGFYIGMTFKNKDELVTSLHIACLKKDFRLAKGPSTRDMTNQLRTELGCKVSYWKIYKGREIAKSLVRGTHEHGYGVVSHFYNAAKAYNKVEFYDHFNQIRDMVPKAAELLESVGFHKWSRAFCLGNRYNIMTSNIAESVNAMFEVKREFPIIALFDEINMRFAKLFHERHMELVNSPNILVPSMEKQISKNINLGNKLLAHQIANYKFSINGHGDVATVDLQRRMCTCRVFYLDKIPCPHAMAALRSQYGAHFGNQIYEYSSSYYSVEKYIIAYCEEINLVPPEDSWIVPLEILEREIPPSYVDPSKPGRR
ncbi:hypothetical protein H5410_013174, partial [Solanum commersonii]